MYYSGESLEKVNSHLKKIAAKKLLAFGPARRLADALFSCITESEYDKRSMEQKLGDLVTLINPDGNKEIRDVLHGHMKGALNILLSKKSAGLYLKIWDSCIRYPYSAGVFRRSFRSSKDSFLYLNKNISLLQDMVYGSAFGEIDVRQELTKKPEYYGFNSLTAHTLAIMIDENDNSLLELCGKIIYGSTESGIISREMIAGLLMSHSAKAHKMIGDLLLAARLQEGLRQAIIETMDYGSREGFLYLLKLIIDNDLGRFSSVIRAFDTWTGLGIVSEKPAVIKRCLETAYRCLSDSNHIRTYLESNDTLQIYTALWAIAFDEVTDVKPVLIKLLNTPQQYKKLTALYFLMQINNPALQNELALMNIEDGDPEVSAWCVKNLYQGCIINEYRYVPPDVKSLPSGFSPDQVYCLLKQVLSGMPKKEIVFKESLFPWSTLTLNASEVIEKMIYCVGMLGNQDQVDRLLPLRDKMDVDVRHGFLVHFLKNPATEQQKTALVEALGDKSSSIRDSADKIVNDISLSKEDYQIIENLLQYKSGDIRKNSIRLLMKQEHGDLLASIERLAFASNENKQLAAAELISIIKNDGTYSDISHGLGKLTVQKDAVTQAEGLHADKASEPIPKSYTLDNGFGLYDPSRLYSPLLPEFKVKLDFKGILALPSKRVKEIYIKLGELIHDNRDYQYESIHYNGSKSTYVLGSEFHLYPINIDHERGIENYPLSHIWISFKDRMGISDIELLSLIYAYNCCGSYGFNAQSHMHRMLGMGYTQADNRELKQFFRGTPYSNQCSTLMDALQYRIPAEVRYNLAYSVSLFLLQSLPEQLLKSAIEEDEKSNIAYRWRLNENYFCDSIQLRFWLNMVKETADSDHAFTEYFNLAYTFYKASDYKADTLATLGIDDFGRAYELGIIDGNELYYELMGRNKSAGHLSDLTHASYHNYKKAAVYKGIMNITRTVINRITEIELRRGEMTTPVSHLAARMDRCYGAEAFVAILLRMGKDSYVRGYNFVGDDSTRKQMFSHLLKCCYPDKEDNEGALSHLLKGKRLSDAGLVDAAMYAPQWMDIVEEYLGWPGLKSAAWYFHAHMNDTFSEEKQTIVARYSAIAPEDFKDGAFDINWFREAYGTIGEDRFKLVYQAAKYVATSGQHRRAQLYADAVTNRLDLKETELLIKEKRNKDQLMAYALIPAADTGDILHRYEFIQAYLKQSKEYGAQRQASEGKAARIALDNLARNAGYQDVNRLMWQMETEKMAAISHLFNLQEVEDVTVRLVIAADGTAEIEVMKDGKPLKNIPARLKDNKTVQQLKAVQSDLKRQRTRARESLERAMVSQDYFTVQELVKLEQNQVIAPLIRDLVFVCGGGYDDRLAEADRKHGYWKNGALVSFDGSDAVIGQADTLRIAHSNDLYIMGVWPQYQHDLFEKQIIQPFKQVFRELYRPNEDELKQLTYSDRYAGHQVQPAKTLALLKGRGWTASYEEGLQKVDFKENVIISLYALADWFSPADIEAPTLERVYFTGRKSYDTIPIDQVSPILFSEAMRDIDLVVSAAHAGGVDPEASLSTIEMRESILAEMLRLMRISNVEIRKTHAFIKGKLGEYTVHLGSGTVQKMAVGSVFIIPVHSQHRGRIFLPFMDDDPRTAEIISKIILLAEDTKIKDPEILRQIRQ